MDKRRYTRKVQDPARDKLTSMEQDTTGNAATDGFTCRSRKPLHRGPYDPSRSPYGEYYTGGGLIDENRAAMNMPFRGMDDDGEYD